MSFARVLDNLFLSASDFLRGAVGSYCRLETPVDTHTISADDGTLVSFIKLNGALKLFGEDEFRQAHEQLRQTLTSYLNKSGHALQFVMVRDPHASYGSIKSYFDPMVATAKNLGVDIEEIMESDARKLATLTAEESVFVVTWTYPSAMPPATAKKAGKQRGKMKVPAKISHGMDYSFLELLLNSHGTFTRAILNALNSGLLNSELLDVHEALKSIRHQVCPEKTSSAWSPRLPGDKFPTRLPEDGDPSHTACEFPSLRNQLFPHYAETDGDHVFIDQKIHRPCTMELGPQKARKFNVLFKELLKHQFPWRISFHIHGDGFSNASFIYKQTMTFILGFSSSQNKMIQRSIDQLKAQKSNGESIVTFEGNFDTWVDVRDFPSKKKALDHLSVQHNYLVASLQAWGTLEVREVTGDPLLPFSASIPGLSLKTPSAKPAAPLGDTLTMMPFVRPASPWSSGSFLLRTSDGKLFPVAQLSRLQAAWIEIGYGGMGSGKSFWINSTNWAYIFQPGLDELPLLGIIDIGPSSSGLIQLLKNSLPKHSQKYVASHKLVMDDQHSVNPFDTPLGCRKPFESQMVFLTNILSAFCTPENSSNPHEAIGGLVRQCIEKAYEAYAHKQAKSYQPNLLPEIDEKIERLNLPVDPHTTWWEIVDMFWHENMTHEATLAQRYAVPVLPDIQKFTRDKGIQEIYDLKDISGEMMTDYVSRKLTEAMTKYPIFRNPTKFDLGEARIISLDLNDVAPKGGGPAAEQQTGIMYLLAWQLIAGKFFYAEEEAQSIFVEGNPQLTAQYQKYHVDQIKKNQSLPKRVVLDEFHRAFRVGPIVSQLTANLETCTRESRKWNISVGIYSQKVTDMPAALIDLATTHYILGADAPSTQRELIERYELNSAGKSALGMVGRPDSRGANCLAVLYTRPGTIQQIVTNTQGPYKMWAFSTTREDMDVRNALYERVGPPLALRALVKLFPTGTVKDHIEEKKEEYARLGIRKNAIEETVVEIEKAIEAEKA